MGEEGRKNGNGDGSDKQVKAYVCVERRAPARRRGDGEDEGKEEEATRGDDLALCVPADTLETADRC